jgi:hypothetical protein
MFVAGLPLTRDDVLELARLVDPGLADRLHTVVDRGTTVLALTVPERETIVRALDDPPAGLAELRGVLLREYEWRVRDRARLTPPSAWTWWLCQLVRSRCGDPIAPDAGRR